MSTSLKSVFISYRRRDSSPIARWLGETIRQNFGRASVFIDTGAIESGDEWPKQIALALKKASVFIVIIGPEWLRAQDKFFKRRIDDPTDWVRKEIIYAIQTKLPIIPLLVLNGELPAPAALPKELKPLTKYQALEFRETQSETDIEQLLDRLEALGLNRTTPRIRYPEPRKEATSLTDDELAKILKKRLPKWKLDDSRVGPRRKRKVELTRTYEFGSFEDAIHFISTAARHISNVDHHPDWENIWRTITVWLTTWDIGHRPSSYDVEMAEYFDQLYHGYESDKPEPKKPVKQTTQKRAKPKLKWRAR